MLLQSGVGATVELVEELLFMLGLHRAVTTWGLDLLGQCSFLVFFAITTNGSQSNLKALGGFSRACPLLKGGHDALPEVIAVSCRANTSLSLCQMLQRRARSAPSGAFLVINFVLMPHAALVKFGTDPTPQLERFKFKVAHLLETPLYPDRTATQEMIHTVNECREAGVVIAGLLLDGEFGRVFPVQHV